jgi:ankyrin repeat protein
LSKAAFHGHIEVVKELLNHNADIEVKNARGRTALNSGWFQYQLKTILYF